MSIFSLYALASASALVLAPAVAFAESDRYFVEGIAELETGWSVEDHQSGDGAIAATIELAGGLELGSGWSITGGVLVEPVIESAKPGSFGTEGAYLDSLLIQYASDDMTFYAGKFAPVFGTAWDVTPGVFGTELAENYELAEFLGVGGDVALGRVLGLQTGELVTSWSVFTADTTAFSNSLLRQRGRLRREHGGVGNTGGLRSYSVAVDAFDLVADGVQLHFAYRNLDADDGLSFDEEAIAAAILWSVELSNGAVWDVNVEWVRMDHPGGGPGDGSALTAGLGLGLGSWRIGASHARLDPAVNGRSDDETIDQFSVGYDFSRGYSIDIGLKRHQGELYADTYLGTILSFAFE